MLTVHRVNETVLVSVLFLFLSGGIINARIVQTRLGAVEGVKTEARNGTLFYAYYGIPFAEPPIGSLRFEPPVEKKPWNGVFNATGVPSPCPQLSADLGFPFLGQEDCLFVNVFTPKRAKPGTNIPVLFYIFGGGFRNRKPSDFGPDYIMSRDIILVYVSYRLGVLGFFSTGDDVISGNMALRDQALAMKWTRENIYAFGGDPNRVTIHGHSAGSMSVYLHTLSPLSKDYFDRAIMQSGFAGPNFVWDRDYTSAYARDLGELLNCPIESTRSLKLCLQSRTAEEIIRTAQEETFVWTNYAPTLFKPVIEDDRVMAAFLNKSVYFGPFPTIRKTFLLGITSCEGAGPVGRIFHPDSSGINMNPQLLFPVMGDFYWTSKLNNVDFIARFLKTRFFGEETVSNKTDITDKAFAKMLSSILYGRNFLDYVQRYGGSKYLYLMNYRYVGGFSYSQGGLDGRFIGIPHANEVPIMFKMDGKTGIAEEDFAFGDELITRWVNFAHSGNPNLPFAINTSVMGAWDAVSSPRLEFLRIDRHGGMEKDYFEEEYGVWRKLPMFSKYFAD